MAKQLTLWEEISVSDTDAHASQRLAHFEDCRSAIDQLFTEALAAKGGSAFDEFLSFVLQFNNLSIYNAMLVRVQRPGAGAVATRRQWARLGRAVRPDAIPIVILQPFGPVLFVFEQSDTEGRPLPGEHENVLFAAGELSTKRYEQTRQAAKKYGIQVLETDQYGALLAGTAAGIELMPETLGGKAKLPFRVRVNAKHKLPTRFATLAHELGHVYCGHLGADPKGRWPSRTRLSREQKELEAEAVAWLVCQRNGVQSRSRDYLRDIVRGADLEEINLYAIFEAANRVESRTAPTEKK